MSYLVGITGGIGSGKTTVSNIFSHLGFKVYNSDERAKYLMQTNDKTIRLPSPFLFPMMPRL